MLNSLAEWLTDIATGRLTVPESWVDYESTLLAKTSNPTSSDDFRPIALLSTVYRIYMAMLLPRL
eukprot:3804887-Prorocentrum_lima.AAC.1